MANRKITEGSLGRGPVGKALSKEMYAAHLSDKGRKRVEEALKFAVKRVSQREALSYGVGEKFAGDLAKIPLSKKYVGRRDLLPKEKALLQNIPNVLFNKKPLAPKVEPKIEAKVEPKAVSRPAPRVVPRVTSPAEPRLAPRVALQPVATPEIPHASMTTSSSASDITSEAPISPKNDEGSEIKSAP